MAIFSNFKRYIQSTARSQRFDSYTKQPVIHKLLKSRHIKYSHSYIYCNITMAGRSIALSDNVLALCAITSNRTELTAKQNQRHHTKNQQPWNAN